MRILLLVVMVGAPVRALAEELPRVAVLNFKSVGSNGLVFHWDGSDWSAEDTGVSTTFRGVWADGEDVWVVGGNGTIVHRSY